MKWPAAFWRTLVGRRSREMDGLFSKLTPRAQRIFSLARETAERMEHGYVGTEHVLFGLVELGQGAAYNALIKTGCNLELVRRGAVTLLQEIPSSGPPQPSLLPTRHVRQLFYRADHEATAMGERYIGTDHLLLACLFEGGSIAANVLLNAGANYLQLRLCVLEARDLDYPAPP